MIDFTQFRLIDWFEESSMQVWARTTLPGTTCPALSSSDRLQRTNALKWKESRVIRLLDETNLLLREITQESAILSPVRLLPVSLVVPILKDCLTLPNLNPTTDWQNGPISSISSLWRSEAMNNASCWSSINLNLCPDPYISGSRLALESGLRIMEKKSVLKRQLEMSRTLPTHINVGFNQFMPILLLEGIATTFAAEFQNCISFRELVDKDTLFHAYYREAPSLLSIIHMQNNSVFTNLRHLQICGEVISETPMRFPVLHTLRIICDFTERNLTTLHLFNCPLMEVLLLDINCDELCDEILSMFCIVSRHPKLRRFRLLLGLTTPDSGEAVEDLTGSDTRAERNRSLQALARNPVMASNMRELTLAGPAFRQVETFFYLKQFVKMCSSLTELTLGDTDFMRIIALTPIAMQHTVTTLRFLRPPGQERCLSNEALVYQFLSVFPNLERISMCRGREEAVDDRNSYRERQGLPKRPPDCTNLIRGILGYHSGSANRSMRQFDIADWSLDVKLLLHVEEEAARSGMVLPPVRFTTEAAKFRDLNASEESGTQGQDPLPDITSLGFNDACAIWRGWLLQ